MTRKQTPLLAAVFLAAALVALSLTLSALTSVQAKVADANITIVKTADPVVYSGSTANFTITINNTSGTTLTNVVVTDPLAPSCDRVIGDFTTTSINYTCSLAGQTADFTNNVTVTGILSGVGTVSDSAAASVEVINPGINIAKAAAQTRIYANQTAFYTYTVSNLGDGRLSAVLVTDDQCSAINGPTVVIGNANSTLDAGEVWAYTCSTALSDDTTNTAIVTATDQLDTIVNDSDTAFVEVINPSISILKTANPTTIVANQTVVYTYTVANPGDDGLIGVSVTDDHCSPVNGPTVVIGDANNVLNPGEIWAYTCSMAVSADTTNTATVTGTDSLGGVVNDSDTASVVVIAPGIEIVKTPDLQIVDSGDDASFTLTVRNLGDVELSNVAVADPQCDTLTGPSGDNGDGVLQTAETWTYSCTIDNVTDGFINSATVTGETPTGGVATAADSAKVILSGAQTCPTDMLAYWKLDEATASTTFDDFYNGLDAECTPGSCPSPVTGIVNNAQAFDGNDAVNVPILPGDESFNWGVNDSFSFEFWMRRPGMQLTTNEVVVGRQGPTHPRPHIWVGPAVAAGNKATFCLFDNNGTGKCISGDTVVTGGGWHHVVAVRDADADKIYLYVDGELEQSADQIYSAGFETTTPLNIGWLNLYPNYRFSGSIDELTLYNRALSLTEVQQHYHEVLSAGRDYCATGPLAPMIFSTPVTEAAVQRPYTYDVDAIGNPVPTYALTVNPAGMTIDPATGVISWKPVVAQQGSHPVEVEARNSAGTDLQSFTVNVAQGPLCPAGMISYWQLDETSGTSYADFFSDNDGACPGGTQCPSPVPGQVNGAQTFDGDETQINVPATPAFNWAVDDSFTFEFWMTRPGTLPNTQNEVAVGRQGPSENLPHIWVGPAGMDGNAATFCLYDTSGTGNCVSGTTVVTGGAWHHIVAVRDASLGQIRIYVDGVQEASVNQTYDAGFGANTSLNIGWLDLTSGYYFLGSIDEVAVYNRALSTTEIQQHHSRGLAGYGYCVTPELAIAKWPHAPTVYADEQVTYTYAVTNTGDDLLSSVSVSDDRCSPVTLVQGNNNLGPSEESTYQCKTTLNADTTNLAVVQANPTVGDPVSATATAFVDVINPAITIAKQANPTTAYPGDLVTYTYTVANTGDDPLSDVSVNDDRCSPVTLTGGDGDLDDKLDLVEIWTFVCSMNVFEDTTNTAIVTANDSLGGPVNHSDTAFVKVSHQVYLPLLVRSK